MNATVIFACIHNAGRSQMSGGTDMIQVRRV